MKTNLTMAGFLTLAGAVAVAVCLGFGSSADARPNYNKAFQAKYADLAAAKEAKCGVCHQGMDKKVRNDYGKAFGKDLDGKKVMDAGKIDAALDKVATEPSAIDGKTFGDLIKDGKLPNTKP
ncbi:MAG TPA: hypothetical protein VG433_11510 [Pirellulales bacterium]|nr:hypothetical protein [Pirellulales bacterium]